MKYLFYLLFLISLVSCREKEQYHLLTIELDKQRQYFMLCQYTLVDTGFVRRVIYEERNNFYSIINPSNSAIINNRYIVDYSANNIYDLNLDSFVLKNRNNNYGDFINLTKTQAIYIRDSSYQPIDSFSAGFVAFDFDLGKRIQLDNLSTFEYSHQGIYSPDKSKRIVLDTTISSKYLENDRDKSCSLNMYVFLNEIYIVKTDSQNLMNVSISYFDNLFLGKNATPILWIDNNRFLTQQGNNQVVLVNTETQKISKFPKIENIELHKISNFQTDIYDNHYFIVNNIWKIDVNNLQLKKVNKIPINKDLEKMFTTNIDWRIIGGIDYLYKGKSILNDSTQTKNYDLLDNHLAIQCSGDLLPPYCDHINLKVFNTETEALKTLEIKNMIGWIGWVKR